MKVIAQVALILLFSFIGDWLQQSFNLPIPGSLIGLGLLFTLLMLKVLPVKLFEQGAEKLVAFMPLFLLPSTTGIMKYGPFLLNINKGLPLFFIAIICTLSIVAVSGTISQRLSSKKILPLDSGSES